MAASERPLGAPRWAALPGHPPASLLAPPCSPWGHLRALGGHLVDTYGHFAAHFRTLTGPGRQRPGPADQAKYAHTAWSSRPSSDPLTPSRPAVIADEFHSFHLDRIFRLLIYLATTMPEGRGSSLGPFLDNPIKQVISEPRSLFNQPCYAGGRGHRVTFLPPNIVLFM